MVVAMLQKPRVTASHLDSVRPALTSTARGSCRLGVAIFATSSQNPYCSSIWSTGSPASLPRPRLVWKGFGPRNRLGGPRYTKHHASPTGHQRARRRRRNPMFPVSHWCDRRGCCQTTSGPRRSSTPMPAYSPEPRWQHSCLVAHQQCPGSTAPHGYRLTTRRRQVPRRDLRASQWEVALFRPRHLGRVGWRRRYGTGNGGGGVVWRGRMATGRGRGGALGASWC